MATSSQPVLIALAPGQWQCLACTVANEQSATQCSVCNSKRSSQVTLGKRQIHLCCRTKTQYFRLTDLKSHTTVGYVRGAIEENARIANWQQKVLFGWYRRPLPLHHDLPVLSLISEQSPLQTQNTSAPIVLPVFIASLTEAAACVVSDAIDLSWTCSACTVENVDPEAACQVCGRIRSVSEQEEFIQNMPFPYVPAPPVAALSVEDASSSTASAMRCSSPPPVLPQGKKLKREHSKASQAGVSDGGDCPDFDMDAAADDSGWGDVEDGKGATDGNDGWGDMDAAPSEDTVITDPETKIALQPTVFSAMSEQLGTSLTPKNVRERMQVVVDQVADLLTVDKEDAALLLRALNWNRDRIQEEFFNNQNLFRKRIGVSAKPDRVNEFAPDAEFECPLCCSTSTVMSTLALNCSHRFCTDCWGHWINAEYEAKGRNSILTHCQEHKCTELIRDSTALSLLKADRIWSFRKWIVDDFVQHSKSVKWCPGKGCNRAGTGPVGSVVVIPCGCGTNWCFACSGLDHRPVTCHDSLEWIKKNSNDGENANWIMANTKMCPSCKVHIEKNQGCNHMTCKQCRHEFCWLCKAKWAGHSACNTFTSEDVKQEIEQASKAKNALQRYIHFYTRYQNHMSSVLFAQKTRLATAERMEQLQDLRGGGIKDVECLMDAVNAVIACQQTLAWTYVYGFYHTADTTNPSGLTALFLSHQTLLAEFTDKLHEMAEKKLEDMVENAFRTSLISFTRMILKFRVNVIQAIQDGYRSVSGDAEGLRNYSKKNDTL